MKKRILTFALLLFAAVALSPGGDKMHAIGHEWHYIVHYNCIIGPTLPDDVMGEWDRDCDGNLTGWGWEPGHNCSRTEVISGMYCGPNQP